MKKRENLIKFYPKIEGNQQGTSMYLCVSVATAARSRFTVVSSALVPF